MRPNIDKKFIIAHKCITNTKLLDVTEGKQKYTFARACFYHKRRPCEIVLDVVGIAAHGMDWA